MSENVVRKKLNQINLIHFIFSRTIMIFICPEEKWRRARTVSQSPNLKDTNRPWATSCTISSSIATTVRMLKESLRVALTDELHRWCNICLVLIFVSFHEISLSKSRCPETVLQNSSALLISLLGPIRGQWGNWVANTHTHKNVLARLLYCKSLGNQITSWWNVV